jgi:hypothetical protein
MSEPSSQEKLLSDWGKILAAVDANREDLAHLEDLRTGLVEGVEALRNLWSDRDLLRTELQRTTDEIQEALGQGRDLVSRIRAGVRSTFGAHSDKLSAFGIKPVQSSNKPKGPAPQ